MSKEQENQDAGGYTVSKQPGPNLLVSNVPGLRDALRTGGFRHRLPRGGSAKGIPPKNSCDGAISYPTRVVAASWIVGEPLTQNDPARDMNGLSSTNMGGIKSRRLSARGTFKSLHT